MEIKENKSIEKQNNINNNIPEEKDINKELEEEMSKSVLKT